MKFILDEDDNGIHLYKDKKTGNVYYYDGTKLVLIDSSIIKKAEERNRHKNDVTNETEEEHEKRVADANATLSNERTIERGLSQAKSAAYKSHRNYERKNKASNGKDSDDGADLSGYKMSTGSLASLAPIKKSINDFVKNQIKVKTDYSYSRFNKKYNNATGGIIKPGKKREEKKSTPVVNVYFDWSGSWHDDDIQRGNAVISYLTELDKNKKIKLNLKYFGKNLSTTTSGVDRGDTKAAPVMKDILEVQPTNVIVMTDSDTSYEPLPKAVVPGAVWFLWKNGSKSNALRNSLAGKQLTKEFDLLG